MTDTFHFTSTTEDDSGYMSEPMSWWEVQNVWPKSYATGGGKDGLDRVISDSAGAAEDLTSFEVGLMDEWA